MFTCANCEIVACKKEKPETIPANCPMKSPEIYEKIRQEYGKENINKFLVASARIESKGYGKWSRVEEIIQFCKSMNYQKLGVAFCTGLQQETKILVKVLKDHGFIVTSVICKNGGIPKEELGLREEEKVRPGNFEAMCNPIGQAILLNEEKTDFNIAVGLCVGHDSLFFKYAEAPTTVLIAKDRVLAHNPAGALYCSQSYYSKKLKSYLFNEPN